jgi:hypothetical protein
MGKNTSQHILPTASNLLGFCLFVITSLHVTKRSDTSNIDEFTAFIALLIAFSCLCSFIALRTENIELEERIETIAEYLFMISLLGIMFIILLLILGVIQ